MEWPVQVAVRIRPLLSSDRFNEIVCVHPVSQHEVMVGNENSFCVNYAVPINWTQQQVFELTMQPRIDHLMQGCNVSVISFGQTNSGKSYSLFGPGLHCAYSETEYGIIPRTIREIFSRLMQQNSVTFNISITFVEVCEERVRDLLYTLNFQRMIEVIEGNDGSVTLTGAEQILCHNVSEVFNWLHVGMNNRRSRSITEQNSSTSHAIFTLTINQKVLVNGLVKHICSKIQFVDLASSEKGFALNSPGYALNSPGFALNSPGYAWNCGLQLDSGLLALNNMVATLVESPWSNSCSHMHSVLTRILKDSFGGSASTLLLCCVSPTSLDYRETLNTLQFAVRVSHIKNYVKTNVYFEEISNSTYRMPVINEHNQDFESHFTDSSVDTFGLEFAASQWLKLVADAEGLLSNLVKSKSLSDSEKQQIEGWLCLKQECDECVGSDTGLSEKTFEERFLERIEELTESDCESNDSTSHNAKSDSNVTDESANESDKELFSDFVEKLDTFVDIFRDQTDILVKNNKEDCVVSEVDQDELTNDIARSNKCSIDKKSQCETNTSVLNMPIQAGSVAQCAALKERRKSIFSSSDQPVITLNSNISDCDFPFQNLEISLDDSIGALKHRPNSKEMPSPRASHTSQIGLDDTEVADVKNENNYTSLPSKEQMLLQNVSHEIKILSEEMEAKQNQLGQILIDLQGEKKKIEEVQHTIEIKEQFLKEMNQFKNVRSSAKHKCHVKKSKLEDQYHKACTNLTDVKKAYQEISRSKTNNSEEKVYYEQEVGKYENLVRHYEKRLKGIEMIKQVAGESSRKVTELEDSLLASRRQMDKFKKHLKKAESQKLSLEQELIEDQKKIKELEQSLQTSLQKLSCENTENEKLLWINEDCVRSANMSHTSQQSEKQLLLQKCIVGKTEENYQETSCSSKLRDSSLIELNERAAHIEHIRKEKSAQTGKADDAEEKEVLRHEIRNLRKTRNCLAQQLCAFQKQKKVSTIDERKFLECDETIEVIDAAIEYKNVLICEGLRKFSSGYEKDDCEILFFERFSHLTEKEICTLLYKYFQKVVELRLSTRKMEVELAEQDILLNAQAWKIHAQNNALQQTRLEADRQLVLLQKENQEKLHLMLRHIGDESSGSSGADISGKVYVGTEVNVYKHENKLLKRKVHELERYVQTTLQVRSRNTSPVAIPHQNLKQLEKSGSSSTTKVTREKNKLIIQQQKPRRLCKR